MTKTSDETFNIQNASFSNFNVTGDVLIKKVSYDSFIVKMLKIVPNEFFIVLNGRFSERMRQYHELQSCD